MIIPDSAKPSFKLLLAILDPHRSEAMEKTEPWEAEGIALIRTSLPLEWLIYIDHHIFARWLIRQTFSRSYHARQSRPTSQNQVAQSPNPEAETGGS